MQAVNGFIPPSARHPVTPTTPEERGEIPIPLPVLCSRGGRSGGRQLYTKRTDHRFCCLPAQFFLHPPSYTDFPLTQERDVYGNSAALQYTKLIPSDTGTYVTEGEPKNPVIYTRFYRSFSGEVAYSETRIRKQSVSENI